MRRWLALVLVAAAAGRAEAQSKRYPPPVVDLDQERDDYSNLWEDAIEPGKGRYDELVAQAVILLTRGTDDARADAEDHLHEATQLLPGEASAWAWLGFANEDERDWAACRDALDRAWTIDPAWEGVRDLGVALGVCRARAGDLDGATEVLERLVARGADDVATFWRLGEVDMAAGRLDDARAALTVALDGSPADTSYVHAAWALAVAADRARDPDAARDAATAALRLDGERTQVIDPPYGFLPTTDAPYYAAIAADAAGLPELALLEYREFRALVTKGPWAERAAEHERALDDFAIADRVAVSGTEPGDAPAIQKAFSRVEADLRGCVAATPRLLLRVTITVVAPKTGVALPAPGVQVAISDGSADKDASDAAIACVSRVAGKIKVAAPSVAGTWTTAMAPVISR